MWMKFASRAASLRDSGDSVFEDQLLLRARLEQDRKLVEAANATSQFSAVQKVDDYRRLLTADSV